MPDMDRIRSLVAFVGMRDPYPENDDESGPLLSLLLEAERSHRPFDEAWLLCTGGTFLERARDLEREARDESVRTRFLRLDFPVKDVIDYAEIWQLLERSFTTIKEQAGSLPRDWHFLLDSGTPQMKTSLFFAARSGLFPAILLQGIPPRFAGGAYKVREVRLDGLPEMNLHEPAGSTVFPGRPKHRPAVDGVKEADLRSAVARRPGEPIGRSPAFAEALRCAISAARYDEPVLILGETGTGKTLIARRIHEAGSRKAGPFVEVNCSAIAENLAESELFGHSRGAFTGADKARSGKFRAAQGGTLFLDEVGDLSLDVQAKLLKAIEDKTVTPVGSDAAESADTRLIAATNRDLPALIREGKFRRDLYERLKVVVIRLPPLRERRDDIRPLADQFIEDWNVCYNEHRYLTEDALLLIESYSWPGNVRGLINALKSAANTAMSDALGPESLPEEIRCAARSEGGVVGGIGLCVREGCRNGSKGKREALPPEGVNLKARLLQVEWDYVSAALRKEGGNREAAAKLLGMTGHAFRKALRERLAAYADEGWEEGI
jgi:DNA-binding NtrC family response regulator